MNNSITQSSKDPTQVAFLAVMPRIERHAQISFQQLKCEQRRQDAVAEAVGLAWKWFAQLWIRGKDPVSFVSVLATFAVRAVRSGRRVCGQERIKDILSPYAQQRHQFSVERLPARSAPHGNIWDEALRDNMQAPIPEQVCFRLDFPRWRRRRCRRHRSVIDALVVGERARDVARRFGLTEGRISQIRHELYADWQQFCGEATAVRPRARTSHEVPNRRRLMINAPSPCS
jgi:hypothetical protein